MVYIDIALGNVIFTILAVVVSSRIARKKILAGVVSRNISLIDREGKARMKLFQNNDGEICFNLYDQSGELKGCFCVNNDGAAEICLTNGNGREGVMITSDSEASAILMFDQDGVPRVAMDYGGDKWLPGFTVMNKKGEYMASMNYYESNPFSLILSEDNRVVEKEGKGVFSVTNEYGHKSWPNL